jgi:hypothetical protein
MRSRLISTALLACLSFPSLVAAQSIVDVARAEEARRKTVRTPTKVYTNEDLLRPDGTGPAPTASSPGATAPADSGKTDATKAATPPAPNEAKKDDPKKDEPKKDETYWKNRMTVAREAAAHDKVLLDALQSRVNALSTDFVNTSDPAQRAVVETNRKTALGEMDRLTKDLEKQNKAMVDTQEEARKANVPPGWLR